MRIISFDPAITNWGIAVWEDDNLVEVKTIITKPEYALTGVAKNLNLIKRASVIREALNKYEADYYVVEIPSGSQVASSAVTMGMVVALLSYIPEDKLIPISPSDIKKFFNLKTAPDKKHIHGWVTARYPLVDKRITIGNHQADAVIAYLVAKKAGLLSPP